MNQSQPLYPVLLQRKTRKAGAQHSLFRLLTHPRMLDHRPVLVCEDNGWLARASEAEGVMVIRLPFPGRVLWWDRLHRRPRFARRVVEVLRERDVRPAVVHGNTHSEAHTGRALAGRLGVPTLITLRDPELTQAGFFKAGGHLVDTVIVNGPWMRERVAAWSGGAVEVVNNGLAVKEFRDPPPLPAKPRRVLVLGNNSPRKGWADLLDALAQSGSRDTSREQFKQLDFIFPSDEPGLELSGKIEALRGLGFDPQRFRFIGHQEDFEACLAEADLVLHPSRSESFGMAALEAVAAGVPMLSTRTGVVPMVMSSAALLVEPEAPGALGACLERVLRDWPEVEFDRAAAQTRLRASYSLDATVEQLLGCYRRCMDVTAARAGGGGGSGS